MPSFTSFLDLYKPGGGSTGTITPDEVVDVDRINQNMDLIDSWAQGMDGRTTSLEDKQGLVVVKPTSVSSKLTIQPDGSLTAASYTAGAFNIIGLFTSTYSRYRGVVSLRTKGSINVTTDVVCLTGTSTAFTGTSYFNQEITLLNGSVSGAVSASASSFGAPFDVSGSVITAFLDIYVGPNYVQISVSAIGRGGTVLSSQKFSSVEGLPSRATGLQVNFGQTVANVDMKFYAYA